MFSWLFVRILVRVAIRMSRKALWTLQSDPEFQCVSMPLPGEEFQTLEKAITSGRVREPVAVWHRIMIEGYPRYEIYTRHGIKFALEEMVFPSKTDAVLWACERQLRRGHIVTAARHYLLNWLEGFRQNLASPPPACSNTRALRTRWIFFGTKSRSWRMGSFQGSMRFICVNSRI